MVDCPCTFGKDIPPEQASCPVCGMDLAPLHRLKGLPRAYRERAALEATEGELEAAAESYIASLAIGGEDAEALSALADLRSRQGRKDEGEALARRAAAAGSGASAPASAPVALRKSGSRRRGLTAIAAIALFLAGAGSAVGVMEWSNHPRVEARASTPPLASIDAVRAAPVAHAPAILVYEVRPNDSLVSLARRFYGDEGQWKRILMANVGIKGPDFVITTGQTLRIPLDGTIVD